MNVMFISFASRLTFYVNAKGQLHVFVNSEHKGAILVGIPVKEQLWVILDLYGTTVSVKFISNCKYIMIDINLNPIHNTFHNKILHYV